MDFSEQEPESLCTGGCLNKWKIIFGAVLMIAGLLFAHIIYALKGLKRFSTVRGSRMLQKIQHFGNALSAGIFFSTGMIHLVPEIIELFAGRHSHEEDEHHEERNEDDEHQEEEDDEEEDVSYPWAYFSIVVAFYVILGIERVLIPKLLGTTSCHLEDSPIINTSNTHHEHDEEDVVTEAVSEKDSIEEAENGKGLKSPIFVRGLVRVLALSVHSLFESTALGLSTSFSTTVNIFVALAAHRWATAISIAFNLAWSLNYISFLLLVVLFTITAPIGISVGALLTSLNQTVQGVFFAISAATFIYLGAFAAVSEEFVEHPVWVLRKYIVMLVGASTICFVTWILVANDIHG